MTLIQFMYAAADDDCCCEPECCEGDVWNWWGMAEEVDVEGPLRAGAQSLQFGTQHLRREHGCR